MAETVPFKPAIPKPSRTDERRDICMQALALAQRADTAGLMIAAYLLDMAALEIGRDFGLFDRLDGPRAGKVP